MSVKEGATLGFGEKLRAAGKQRGRLCVGIDPHPYLLEQWGLSNDIDGLRRFSQICVEAFAADAALVKPQVAFYEAYGSRGLAVLEETLAELREAGCLTVADAKRGDIGSTMAGYARAWLGENSPLRADSVTVSPYLGVGALKPVFDTAAETRRGVFVLAATSNPEAIELQGHVAKERSVAQYVVDECTKLNAMASPADEASTGDIGVVVGATLKNPPVLDELNGPILLPGVGAQGAGAADVAEITRACPDLGFANVSRAVLQAGPNVSDLRKALKSVAQEFRVSP